METAEFYLEELNKAKKSSFELLDKWGTIIQQFEKKCDVHMYFSKAYYQNSPTITDIKLEWSNDDNKKWRIMSQWYDTTSSQQYEKPYMQTPFYVKSIFVHNLDDFLKSFIAYVSE